jgi:HAMP domain-containing protein
MAHKKSTSHSLSDTTVLQPNSNGHSQNKNGNNKKTNTESKTSKSFSKEDSELDVKNLLRVLSEVKNGNFAVRMPIDEVGISGKICDTLNDIIVLNATLVEELNLARNIIGNKGKLNHRVELPRSARGSWNSAVESINTLISDLVHPTIEIAHVISSVAKGNLSQQMSLQIGDHMLEGEFGRIATEVNDMVKAIEFIFNGSYTCGKRSWLRRNFRWAGKSKGCCLVYGKI